MLNKNNNMENVNKVDDIFKSMAEQSSEGTDNIESTDIETPETPVEEIESSDEVEENENPSIENVEEEGTEVNDSDGDGQKDNDLTTVSDWDEQEENNTLEKETEVYKDIGKAIGIEVESKDTLISEFQAIKSENEQLKAKVEEASSYNDIPEDLKKAIEIAKSGGDYSEYLELSQVDYSKISDEELLLSQVRSYFPEGEDGDDEAREWLDSMTTAEQKIQAGRLRRTLEDEKQKAKQEKLEAIENESRAKEEFVKAEKQKLRKTVDSIESISDFKLTKSHKSRIFEDISNGKIAEKLFGVNGDGSANYQKMAETYFKTVYFDKIVDYLKSKSGNEAKKRVLQETSNANVNSNGSQAISNEGKDGLDLLINSFKQ